MGIVRYTIAQSVVLPCFVGGNFVFDCEFGLKYKEGGQQ